MATQVLSSSHDVIEQSPRSRSPMNFSSQRITLKMPLKILDPGRAKLTTVETKRIISVLDDTILKVELVTMFSHVMENLEDFSTTLGPELWGAFTEHLQLSTNMKATLAWLEEEGLLLKGVAKGDLFAAKDQSGQLHMHSESLKSSVRNIVRLFYMNPLACQAVRDAAFARSPTADLLLRALSGLRRFLFEMLLTTPLEEKEKMKFMEEIALRDKKNMEAIEALEDELEAEIHNRDEEISKKNASIKELKTHLHNLSKISENQIQRTRTEVEKQQKGEVRSSQAKCAKTLQEIQQLRAQLNALVAENRESELTLRKEKNASYLEHCNSKTQQGYQLCYGFCAKKKYKVEIEIENWVQKYDMEMMEKQVELEEINEVYTVEKAQLKDLREKFDILDEEFSQIQEERELKQEQREKAEKELAILVRAATLIQALWKGYLVRSLLRSKRRKKGKGKKAKK